VAIPQTLLPALTVPSRGAQLADTADQDADKSRTYDYARLEYSNLDMILYIGTHAAVPVRLRPCSQPRFYYWLLFYCYVDADELFFCPQAADSIAHQRTFQQRTMETFHSRGVEEMRFVRIPYSGL
jgi:hypothetical protein